jgi:Tol biopolymer transport system component
MRRAVVITGIFAAIVFIAASSIFSAQKIIKGSTIAFNRGGDIWLMESDGSNQRPFIAGITNAIGRMSWSPDNKILAFARMGEVDIKFPEGGGGNHKIYDLFYARADSSNNWWEGITETMSAQGPQFSRDGTKILFVHDKNANTVNATLPKYRPCFYDTKTYLLRDVEFDSKSDLLASSPTMSPDMKQIAFVVMKVQEQQFTPTGIAIVNLAKFPMPDDSLLNLAKRLPSATAPSWSPDGQWIAYLGSDISNSGLFVIKPDLTGKKQIYNPKTDELNPSPSVPAWSPDSKMILFTTANGSIYKIPVIGGEAVRLSGPGNDQHPAWCN